MFRLRLIFFENKLVDKNDFFIWVFWAQGFENAPELVKACYKNLINHNGKAVRAITLGNIHEYVSIPNYISAKVKKGTISLTHYLPFPWLLLAV